MAEDSLVQCYNRGCSQKYNPAQNHDDSCRHHSGLPVFHDAYKGWSCCKKKCTDFTEFLNIQGCTLSKHSNIKPPEPEKPEPKDVPDTEIIEVKPLVASRLTRTAFESPMVKLVPEIAPSLKQMINSAPDQQTSRKSQESNEIAIGTICKNSACNTSYEGPISDGTPCKHHPGVPIFHEGLKYWSCCQKKTTEFDVFLSQVGCTIGEHVWVETSSKNTVDCRWDHHQTASHVVVSIYAKQYCPKKSVVKLHPCRLYANLVFPEENGAAFNLDVELCGVVDVQASRLSMFGTKVEIKLKKAEPGSWRKLDLSRVSSANANKTKSNESVEDVTKTVDAVDLSDL